MNNVVKNNIGHYAIYENTKITDKDCSVVSGLKTIYSGCDYSKKDPYVAGQIKVLNKLYPNRNNKSHTDEE